MLEQQRGTQGYVKSEGVQTSWTSVERVGTPTPGELVFCTMGTAIKTMHKTSKGNCKK